MLKPAMVNKTCGVSPVSTSANLPKTKFKIISVTNGCMMAHKNPIVVCA